MALERVCAEKDRADQFNKDLEKCDQITESSPRAECRTKAAQNFQGNGSGSAANSNTSAYSNTSGGGSTSNNPEDKQDDPPKALPAPKDPDVDYSGQSCSYFTRPQVENEVRLNYYAKGSCISYGKSSYECGPDGRWLLKGSSKVFRCETAEEAEGPSGKPLRPWIIKKN